MGENHNDPTGSGSATQVVSTVGPIIQAYWGGGGILSAFHSILVLTGPAVALTGVRLALI